jgi:MFS family permease
MVLGMYSIGSAIGPLVGGSIIDSKKLGWRFVFWIDLGKFPVEKSLASALSQD